MEPTSATLTQMLPTHHQALYLHAGFWRRVAAWIIDWLVLSAIFWVLWLVFGAWWLPWALFNHPSIAYTPGIAHMNWQPRGIVVAWLYFASCESSKAQATVGKMTLGLQVTDEYGRRIGFGRATGRYFGKYVSALILFMGFMMAGWTARKQALHDLMAGCCVVCKATLAAWRGGDSTDAGATSTAAVAATPDIGLPPQTGIPGWAIALIVVAGFFFLIPVAAIVAAVAIPAYRNYNVRTEVSQGLAATGRARALVAEYIGQRGALPASNADLGLPRPEAIRARYVTSVRVADGKVVVTYGNQADRAISGGHVVISPSGNAIMLHWHCSSPDIRVTYLPSNCRP